jgi:protein TonB
MFEQTILTNGKQSRRFWTTCLGVTGEAVVVVVLVVVPMMWPQALPQTRGWLDRYIPTVPPPPPGPQAKPTTTHVEPRRSAAVLHPFTAPPAVPRQIDNSIQEPPAVEPSGYVPGSTGPATSGGGGGGFDFSGIFNNIGRPLPVVRPPEPRATSAPPKEPPKPIRIRIGTVDPAKLLVSVKPVYPPLARTAGISGTVEIEAVIGVDGRLAEVRVKRGHPLLIGAAVDAVKQWVYKPTYLNGHPVEVSTTIMVNFILGH